MSNVLYWYRTFFIKLLAKYMNTQLYLGLIYKVSGDGGDKDSKIGPYCGIIMWSLFGPCFPKKVLKLVSNRDILDPRTVVQKVL